MPISPPSRRTFCQFGYHLGARAVAGDPVRAPRYAEGTLEASQRRDDMLARTVMTARLHDAQNKDVAPELIDAQLVQWSHDGLHLVGFERDALTRRDTVQTWFYTGFEVDRYSCQLIRDAGRPKPRWIQSAGTWHKGRISLAEELDPVFQRWVTVARFKSPRQDTELVPPLVAAKLIQLREHRAVLTGVDRHHETGAEVAQTWLLIRADQASGGAGALWGDE